MKDITNLKTLAASEFSGGVKTSPYNNNGINIPFESTKVGDPILSVTGKLYENCIWGDKSGVLLNPKSYPLLFKEYGTKFGGDGVNTFGIPNFADCAIWGNETPGQRLNAALPNITGRICQGTLGSGNYCNGVFRQDSGILANWPGGSGDWHLRLSYIDASLGASVYKSGTTTVYPNRMTVRVMIRYQ